MQKVRVNNKVPKVSFPDDKLLLIDLDKTLIDQNYRFTDTGIFSEIQRVQNLGWQIGLSSDTPLDILKNWKKEFGMNGPIIAERGAAVLLKDKIIEIKPSSKKYFRELKEELINQILIREIPFYLGDAVSFLRNHNKMVGTADRKLVLINGYRKYSLGFWGKDILEDGDLENDNLLVTELIQTLEKKMQKAPFDLEYDFNKDYGLFIVSMKDANKRVGTKKLMEEMKFSKIGMIGDSKTDIVGSDISFHYAVGNSKLELKEVCDYTAKSDYSAGVVEILNLIK